MVWPRIKVPLPSSPSIFLLFSPNPTLTLPFTSTQQPSPITCSLPRHEGHLPPQSGCHCSSRVCWRLHPDWTTSCIRHRSWCLYHSGLFNRPFVIPGHVHKECWIDRPDTHGQTDMLIYRSSKMASIIQSLASSLMSKSVFRLMSVTNTAYSMAYRSNSNLITLAMNWPSWKVSRMCGRSKSLNYLNLDLRTTTTISPNLP